MMNRILKKVIAACLCLGVLLSGLMAASAAPYAIDEKVECTGYTDFSNPILFQAEESSVSYRCFLIDLNGIKWRVAVMEQTYPYFEAAFTGKPMTFEGLYAGVANDGVAVIRPVTLIEGEQRTNLMDYLWELNKGSMDNLNFTAYNDLYGLGYLTVGEDGSYMEFDSNPWNLPSKGMAAQIDAIISTGLLEDMNKDFGLPDWLYEEMVSTRAVDGRQKEVFDYLTVTWSYHPDQGLEAIYRKN